MHGIGVAGHVWRRHELENYLLEIPAISRLSRLAESTVVALLESSAEALREEFRAGYVSTWMRTHRGHDARRALTEAQAALDDLFACPLAERLNALPGKELRAQLNQSLAATEGKQVSDRGLAAELQRHEIDHEISRVLTNIESSI